ncbi:hypothetical protein EYZ11_003073 [Aspergillus tanneri]|uniref:FAD-binding domain-containing protein n=1 Tax=Aspergillus tanneri TaxID=1220188 RepID=A0A4V3UQ29_9EURO|nr:hypothetical protein EYZ11_003073 [Aspergillus tanneri]
MAVEELASDTILIVGGGPVGLILATTLAHHGVKSVLIESNLATTRWPKMDLTIARSMEIFRCLGIADDFRNQRRTMPLEPWQRVSQEVFETWMKELGEENPMVDLRFGWKATSARELDDCAEVQVTDVRPGTERTIRSPYGVGCDGANSVMRNSLGIEIDGGPM